MSAGFIPMVSTTPPPIDEDDDDFTDFMDGGNHEDFGDFSTPVYDDDFSYPSNNSPPEMSPSLQVEGDRQIKVPFGTGPESPQEEVTCSEVEIVLCDSEGSHSENTNRKIFTPIKQDTVEEKCVKMIENCVSVDQENKPDELEYNGTIERKLSTSPPVNDPILKDKGPEDDTSELDDWMDFTDSPLPQTADPKCSVSPQGEKYEPTELHQDSCVESTISTKVSNRSVSPTQSEERDIIPEEHGIGTDNIENGGLDTDSGDSCNRVSGYMIPEENIYSQFLEESKNSKSADEIDDCHLNTVEEKEQNPVALHTDGNQGCVENCDDFADFASASPEEIASESQHTDGAASIENANDSFDCDFGAFESTAAASCDAGFANFSEQPDPSTASKNGWPEKDEDADFGAFAGENDDFGAFSSEIDQNGPVHSNSSSNVTWSAVPEPIAEIPTISEKITNYVTNYLRKEEDKDTELDSIFLLEERLKTDILSKDAETHSTISTESLGITWPGDLWDQLEDIDNTIALDFVWNGSGHNKLLLDSLGMLTQNILFSGAKQAYYVPTYYAAGLGLVDPAKGILKPMSAAEKITAISPSEKNAPASLDEAVTSPQSYPEWKSVADMHDSGATMIIESSGSWSHNSESMGNSNSPDGSGVQNGSTGHDYPTQDKDLSVPIISSSMDLDYFDSLPSVQVGERQPGNSDLIDPELLEFTTAPSTEPPPPPKDSGSATLLKILTSIKNAGNSSSTSITTMLPREDESKWQEEESKLSTEAQSVLQGLPDLSYMKSKVLMFPMNMSRVNMGEEV